MNQKTLILIDANALIHRSFHALPPLTTKKGEMVNGVYGFCSILLKTLRELKPDYVAAAFDLPEPTFRHLEYKEYKAHRPKTPEELKTQFVRVKEILTAFGVPIYEMAGFEADDTIAALTKQVEPVKDLKCLIVTGDLDLLQLVSDEKVAVCTLKKGISDTIIYDEQGVEKRFGLKPEQLVDFKALKGDPSDNIPGVPGIGEKTAAALLQEFGTLEGIYEAMEKKTAGPKTALTPKLIGKLREFKEQAFLSKKLAQVRFDVPLKFNLENAKFGAYDREAVIKIFQELEFFTLLERLPASSLARPDAAPSTPSGASAKNEEPDLGKVLEGFHVASLIEDIKKEMKIVVGLPAQAGLGEDESGQFFYISPNKQGIFKIEPADIKDFKEIFEDQNIEKIAHDLKPILKVFREQDIECLGRFFDTKIASWLLNPGERDYELPKIVFRELGLKLEAEQVLFLKIWDLKSKLEQKLKESELNFIFEKIEMPLIGVLAEIERAGVKIDVNVLKTISEEVAGRISNYEKKIYNLAGGEFNVNSPAQLSQILFEKLKVPTKGLRKTPGGVISTQASELLKIKNQPIVALILEYRELAKLKNTYLDALPVLVNPKTGRLHTTFIQTGTATGRLASERPNLQNIPVRSPIGKKIRSAFVAEDGWSLAAFDYSQIELRIIASVAGDKKMIEAFKVGKDIHRLTAAEVNDIEESKVSDELRRQAKALNFGVIYGMSAKSFAETSGISQEQAERFIEEYFNDFSGIKNYIDEVKQKAVRDGYVKTLLGRRRYLPEINSPNWQVRQAAERMAVNMPIQGLAADIIKLAMIEIYNQILAKESGIRMILQVHDELVFEMKNDKIKEMAPKIKKIMEEAYVLEVPFEVETRQGKKWGELK